MKNSQAIFVLLLSFWLPGCGPEQTTQKANQKPEAEAEATDQNPDPTTANLTKNLEIPMSLKKEHQEIHRELEKLLELPGGTGKAAKLVADKLHEHFKKEEAYAMPPLGLLSPLAKGEVSDEMQQAIYLSEKLKAEMPVMLAEHQQIVAALDKLQQVAKTENQPAALAFAEKLKLHAQNEEQVLYPAAILVGDYLKLKLKK